MQNNLSNPIEPSRTLKIKVENQTAIDQEEYWNEGKRALQQKYVERGIPFDINTIQSKEQMDNAIQVINNIDRTKKEKEAMPKEPPKGGSTALLNEHQTGLHTTKIQLDENSFDWDFLKFDSTEQLVEFVEKRVKKNDPQAKKVLGQLTRKMLEKPLNMEYKGTLKSLLSSEKRISEFDNEETKNQKIAYNERIKKERSNWKNLN